MKNVIYDRKPLGNPRFNWKQRDFALSTFNCIGEDTDLIIRNCKEAGFNLLEVGWGSHEKVWETVDACEKHGIDLIFQDLSLFSGMMHRHDDRPVDDNVIRETVRTLKNKKHTVGFYVWDEPYCDYLFREARRQSDIILEENPDALMFSVFPPSYNPGPTWDNGKYYDSFEQYIKELEPPVLSMDYYPVGNYCGLYPGLEYTEEKQLDDSPMWLDLAVARNLARKYNLPFWFYYQSCHIYKTDVKITFPMVRMMMYAGALYGAKGLQNYTVTGTCADTNLDKPFPTERTVLLTSGERGDFFDEQKKIHEEFKMLGNTLLALSNRAVYHSSDVKVYGKYGEIYKDFEDNIADSKILEGTLPTRCSVGELCDDYGNDYLFVLNRDFEKELCSDIPLSGSFNVYEVSREDGMQRLIGENTDKISVSLVPGDAVLLRVQPADEEKFIAEYVLS